MSKNCAQKSFFFMVIFSFSNCSPCTLGPWKHESEEKLHSIIIDLQIWTLLQGSHTFTGAHTCSQKYFCFSSAQGTQVLYWRMANMRPTIYRNRTYSRKKQTKVFVIILNRRLDSFRGSGMVNRFNTRPDQIVHPRPILFHQNDTILLGLNHFGLCLVIW